MKIPWKGFAILAVLVASIIYDIPSLKLFMPEDPAVETQRIETRLNEINKIYDELSAVNLAVPQAKKGRITLLLKEGKSFHFDNPIFQEILGKDNFVLRKEATQSFLEISKKASRDIFISKVAAELNSVLTNNRKIESIKMNKAKDAIIFKMEEGKRLASISQPVKGMIKDDLEWVYDEEGESYISGKKSLDNVVSLGLDLQGGMYLDVGVKTDDVIHTVLDEMAEEIESLLLADNVDYETVNRISETEVELVLAPGETFEMTDEAYTNRLRWYDVIKQENGYLLTLQGEEIKRIKSNAIDQALETIRNRIDALGVKEPSIQKQGEESIIIQLPGLKDPARARKVIGTAAVLNFMLVAQDGSIEAPRSDQVVLPQEHRDKVSKELVGTTPFLLQKKVMLKGDAIRDARVSFNQNGEATVSISFDEMGTRDFAKITADSVGRRLAIVLDNKVQSAPRINEPIPGGEAQISGNFTPEEARDLAIVLRSGALPAPLVIHEERTVGASLGNDSINKSFMALVIGFCGVIIFMILYYNVSGIFAVLALIFNLLLIVATLAYFQATLTLPGMAGVILTIGMAVDANVLIFERIREELAKGSPIRRAVNTGFQKATITILDSNITTILAAIVLFQFGSGPIKGFSVTLSIGIAASMFTSIVVGRFLFELFYLNKKNLKSISI